MTSSSHSSSHVEDRKRDVFAASTSSMRHLLTANFTLETADDFQEVLLYIYTVQCNDTHTIYSAVKAKTLFIIVKTMQL